MALPTDLDTLLARVDALRDEIDAMRPLDPVDSGRAMQRLRLEWTYHSNAIEGNSLTYGETRALLMHGVTAHGKPLKDHLDIRRHREVIEYLDAFVGSDEPLTLAVLREMHRMLMGETYEVTAETPDGERVKRTMEGGVFKALPNNVVTETGETHYYASPEETPALMTDLLDALREAGDAHPVVQAALFHHRFVEIHPFPDGNGRTARVLTNLLLMRAGYVPAVIRQDQRPAYYGALSEADGDGDTAPIVSFVAEELAETMELYLRALKGEPDPTAFSKRAALVVATTESLSQGTSMRNPEDTKRLGEQLVGPLATAIGEGVRKLAPAFDREEFEAWADVEGEQRNAGRLAFGAVHRRRWRQVYASWTLHEHRLSPGDSVKVELDAIAKPEAVTVSVSVDDFALETHHWKYSDPVSPERVREIAESALEFVLDIMEALADTDA